MSEIKKQEGLLIPMEDIIEALRAELDREPTDREITGFINHLEVDIPQWLKDSARSYEVE